MAPICILVVVGGVAMQGNRYIPLPSPFGVVWGGLVITARLDWDQGGGFTALTAQPPVEFALQTHTCTKPQLLQNHSYQQQSKRSGMYRDLKSRGYSNNNLLSNIAI